MRTAAVLPVKRFALAKQRLGATVADPVRLALARAMVADVLSALGACPEIGQVILVTSEDSVARAGACADAIVLCDAIENGQSEAVMAGIERALGEQMERVLCVPGDCPALDPTELSGLLGTERSPGPGVVIVPDRHGTGTNGLLLSPPAVIAPSFGPGSCARHQELADRAGASCRLEHLPSLMLDVDTGEDLRALRRRLGEERALGARTRTVLGEVSGEQPRADRWPASAPAA
jgi:2-phospho-L-lactate/phosphoenolpyruvate guanylyltransferase